MNILQVAEKNSSLDEEDEEYSFDEEDEEDEDKEYSLDEEDEEDKYEEDEYEDDHEEKKKVKKRIEEMDNRVKELLKKQNWGDDMKHVKKLNEKINDIQKKIDNLLTERQMNIPQPNHSHIKLENEIEADKKKGIKPPIEKKEKLTRLDNLLDKKQKKYLEKINKEEDKLKKEISKKIEKLDKITVKHTKYNKWYEFLSDELKEENEEEKNEECAYQLTESFFNHIDILEKEGKKNFSIESFEEKIIKLFEKFRLVDYLIQTNLCATIKTETETIQEITKRGERFLEIFLHYFLLEEKDNKKVLKPINSWPSVNQQELYLDTISRGIDQSQSNDEIFKSLDNLKGKRAKVPVPCDHNKWKLNQPPCMPNNLGQKFYPLQLPLFEEKCCVPIKTKTEWMEKYTKYENLGKELKENKNEQEKKRIQKERRDLKALLITGKTKTMIKRDEKAERQRRKLFLNLKQCGIVEDEEGCPKSHPKLYHAAGYRRNCCYSVNQDVFENLQKELETKTTTRKSLTKGTEKYKNLDKEIRKIKKEIKKVSEIETKSLILSISKDEKNVEFNLTKKNEKEKIDKIKNDNRISKDLKHQGKTKFIYPLDDVKILIKVLEENDLQVLFRTPKKEEEEEKEKEEDEDEDEEEDEDEDEDEDEEEEEEEDENEDEEEEEDEDEEKEEEEDEDEDEEEEEDEDEDEDLLGLFIQRTKKEDDMEEDINNDTSRKSKYADITEQELDRELLLLTEKTDDADDTEEDISQKSQSEESMADPDEESSLNEKNLDAIKTQNILTRSFNDIKNYESVDDKIKGLSPNEKDIQKAQKKNDEVTIDDTEESFDSIESRSSKGKGEKLEDFKSRLSNTLEVKYDKKLVKNTMNRYSKELYKRASDGKDRVIGVSSKVSISVDDIAEILVLFETP